MCKKQYCIPRWNQDALSNHSFSERGVATKKNLWKPGQEITIGFLEGSQEKRDIVKHFSVKWLQYANLKFTFIEDASKAMIRVAFDENDGAWSYLGTQCLNIPKTEPTMNFGFLGEAVVIHEMGHALSLQHEMANPRKAINWNKPVVYAELAGHPNYWSKETVDWNVFRLLTFDETIGTEFDPLSAMCYSFPASWNFDGISVGFNDKISALDAKLISELYPKNTTTDVEEPPKLDYSEQIAKIFYTRKMLNELSKSSVIRVATFCNVTFSARWSKGKILDGLVKKLGI